MEELFGKDIMEELFGAEDKEEREYFIVGEAQETLAYTLAETSPNFSVLNNVSPVFATLY